MVLVSDPSAHRVHHGEPLTQGSIESEIMRLSSVLEDTTDELGKACESAAHAEIRWKHAEASSVLQSEQRSAELRKAEALVRCKKEYTDYRIAEAMLQASTEKCRTLRAQLDALRTLSANVRAQT